MFPPWFSTLSCTGKILLWILQIMEMCIVQQIFIYDKNEPLKMKLKKNNSKLLRFHGRNHMNIATSYNMKFSFVSVM